MTLEKLKTCKYGLTHNGTFHADDVFASAFLQLINPHLKIIRSSFVPRNFTGIVFDIGGGEFDHHDLNNEKRTNGIPYASFGKLWRKYAPQLWGKYVYNKVDKKLIQALDLSDNTGKYDSLCLAISSFNPSSDNETGDKEFFKAVDFAKTILNNLICNEQKNQIEEEKVKEIYNNSFVKEILIFKEGLHFTDTLPDTEAVYVIFPSKRGGYMAQGVPKNCDTIELKKPFPKIWTEKLPKYLTFCHNSRFLIAGETLEDLIHACNVALKEEE